MVCVPKIRLDNDGDKKNEHVFTFFPRNVANSGNVARKTSKMDKNLVASTNLSPEKPVARKHLAVKKVTGQESDTRTYFSNS